jgi:chromosome segregation ATPase
MYQGLGFDPTPGDLTSVTQLGTHFTEAADALADIEPARSRAGERSQPWQGAAADAFRARLLDIPPSTEEARLRRAAVALDRWADTLTVHKRRAEELDAQAVRLRRRLDDARDLLQDKQNARDLAATAPTVVAAEADLASVSTLVASIESELDGVLTKARELEEEHLRAADAVAAELSGAEIPQPATESTVARTVVEALRVASSTSGTLAGLLLPAATTGSVPTGAAAALAAAMNPGERP